MFGTQTAFCVTVAVVVALAAVTFAQERVITGDFTEYRKDELPNGFMTGKFFYYYNSKDDGVHSRVRFQYNFQLQDGNLFVVSELYDFEAKARYSMCSNCTAHVIDYNPDRWWYDGDVYQEEKKEGNNIWYKNKKDKRQVKRILMSGSSNDANKDPAKLVKVEFTDGRIVEVQKVEVDKIKNDDPAFKINEGLTCPSPSCAAYVDMVFIIDNSYSLRSAGNNANYAWRKSKEFIDVITSSFDFGDNAAEAAVLQFNGPTCLDTDAVEMVQYCKGHETNDMLKDKRPKSDIPPGRNCNVAVPGALTASVIAGDDGTVSPNRQELLDSIPQNKPEGWCTCMAYALQLAKDVFDKSPRAKYSDKPGRLVVVMTDGADYCPNMTAALAEDLRRDYGATFVTISVGLKCEYDKNYLKNISSLIGNEPAYYSANDFEEIIDYAKQMFSPLCDELQGSACGAACKGFCGCGQCLCPTCDPTKTECESYKCDVVAGTSNGCVNTAELNAKCEELAKDKCYDVTCNAETKECDKTYVCKDVEATNWGSCRVVSCDDGDCSVKKDESVCELKSNKCEQWKCLDVNDQGKPGEIIDKDTGCKLVTNKTNECEGKNKGCMKYKCNVTTGNCDEAPTCGSNACYGQKCVKKNGGFGQQSTYVCEEFEQNRPRDTFCVKYECPNVNNGWVPNYEKRDSCQNRTQTDECHRYRCNDTLSQCVNAEIEDCDYCKNVWQECEDYAVEHSSSKECMTGYCKRQGNQGKCFYDTVDCSKSELADEVAQKNEEDPYNSCLNVDCDAGNCVEVPTPRKPHDPSYCWDYICVGSKETGWSWERTPTFEQLSCVNDSCTSRVCDDELEQCVPTDICESNSTECVTYTCEIDAENDVRTCKANVTELVVGECMKQTCKDGKIIEEPTGDLEKVCPVKDGDKCLVPTCGADGMCHYEVKPAPGNDICMVYECDPKTGEFDIREKCNDGLFCTDDKCTINGECRNVKINCYERLNMTNYPCFRAECQEENSRCYRKLKKGVFIDICGNCISDGTGDDESSSSDLADAMVACVDAPEEGILKEGLAAASIAMIVLGAIIIGAAIAASSVLGTKALLDRAHAANNQSAHTNPLFENNDAEMTNPTFAGEQ